MAGLVAFTTDDFWTRTAPGQHREANVRASGVFAVAGDRSVTR